MLEALIVGFLVLWLLGYLGPARLTRLPQMGNRIHILLIVVLVLVIVRVLD